MIEELIESNRPGVLKYYNKTEDALKQDINLLNEWFEKQPHLPKPEENKLIVWLIFNKFSLEKTKRSFEIHYTIRNLIPEFFTNCDVQSPKIQQTVSLIAYAPLPRLTPNLDRIQLFKFKDEDPAKYDVFEASKVVFLVCELRALVECNVGEQLIYDLQYFKLGHLTKISLPFLKKLYITMKEAYAAKLHGVHFLNVPPSMDTILAMLKRIVKPKIYNRIHVHKDLESLHAIIPKELLPKDYGGNEPPFDEIWVKWIKELERMRPQLNEELKKKSDESKRIGNLNGDIFGSMHGSFRQLQID